jgi:recombination protein RecT
MSAATLPATANGANVTTAIATAKPTTLRGWLQSDALKNEVAKVLPKHMKPERMMRIAITALTRVPKLNDCTQESFVRCLLDLSSWGLEPNGREAHLIPYGKECTLIIDYKGLVTLAYRSGVVKKIHADVVRAGDVFEYNLGEVSRHVPWAYRTDAKPPEPGEVVAAYCFVQMADGVTKCEVMTKEEVESIRKRSKAGNSGPWVSDWCEMAKKTAFRRASKWLPLAAEVKDVFERDDDRIIDSVYAVRQPSTEDRTAALEDRLSDMLNGSPESAE